MEEDPPKCNQQILNFILENLALLKPPTKKGLFKKATPTAIIYIEKKPYTVSLIVKQIFDALKQSTKEEEKKDVPQTPKAIYDKIVELSVQGLKTKNISPLEINLLSAIANNPHANFDTLELRFRRIKAAEGTTVKIDDLKVQFSEKITRELKNQHDGLQQFCQWMTDNNRTLLSDGEALRDSFYELEEDLKDLKEKKLASHIQTIQHHLTKIAGFKDKLDKNREMSITYGTGDLKKLCEQLLTSAERLLSHFVLLKTYSTKQTPGMWQAKEKETKEPAKMLPPSPRSGGDQGQI